MENKEIRKNICDGLNKIWDKHPKLSFPEILKQYLFHPDAFVDGAIFDIEDIKLKDLIDNVLSGKVGYLYEQEKKKKTKSPEIQIVDKKKKLYRIGWIGL